jgi:hypothetical protein
MADTDTELDTYLNDHLGGATLGSELAAQIWDRAEGTPLGRVMARVAPEIEEDRQSLVALMERLGTATSPVKQATTWVAEKATRLKFSGATSGEPDLGLFLALETLTLGVTGKLALWTALEAVAADHPVLAATDLATLIARARAQRETLEGERLAAAGRALQGRAGAQ